jgi:large subunit ribosomal protein L3
MIGLLAKKCGMSSIFDKGKLAPVTVLEVGPCPVVQVKSVESDGYNALQLGFGEVAHRGKPKKDRPKTAAKETEFKTTKPLEGHFKKAGVNPTKVLQEFRDFPGDHKVGDVLKADMFKVGDKVDIIGNSKGRGYSGVIKRHGFGRPNQTHGTHESFRGSGSIGQHSYPARTWPGQRMAGRLGGDRHTTKNLQVVAIDAEKGLVLIRGAVPGANGGIVTICFSKKVG